MPIYNGKISKSEFVFKLSMTLCKQEIREKKLNHHSLVSLFFLAVARKICNTLDNNCTHYYGGSSHPAIHDQRIEDRNDQVTTHVNHISNISSRRQ